MRPARSPILEVGVNTILTTVLLFSVFLLLAGHNQPGGGFAGGLVAGAGLVLRYVDGGAQALRRMLPVAPAVLLGTGLLLAAAAGVVPLVLDGAYLESAKRTVELPLLGDLNLVSSLAFDAGVYLVVVGVVGAELSSLGAEPVRGEDGP